MMRETERPPQIDRIDAVQDVERLLLEAASAIQRLIAERDALRRDVNVLEGELARLHEQTKLIRDSYRRLATEFSAQLQLLDTGLSNAAQDPPATPSAQPEDAQSADATTSDTPPFGYMR